MELNARLGDESLADLKTYLRWTALATAAPYLSSAFAQEHFAFYRAYLRGVKEQRPRWKTCVDPVDRTSARRSARSSSRAPFRRR